MQIQLTFDTQELRLPMAHRSAVQGLIYHALEKDRDYQAFLHDRGYTDGLRQFKVFTFGELQGPYTVEAGQIRFRGPVGLQIRSADPRSIQLLLRHFDQGTACQLMHEQLTVRDIRLDDRHILAEQVDIRMLAPAVAYRTEGTQTIYYSPMDPEFYQMIMANAARKWESVYDCPMPGDLWLEPLEPAHRYKKVVTRFKQTYITGWKGAFRLIGCAPVLDLLYQTGLGSKNSQGFGMFEVL